MLTRRYYKLCSKTLNNIACAQKFTQTLDPLLNTKATCYSTDAKKDDVATNTGIAFINNYNLEQSEKILNTINNSSLDHLLRYEISKARANKLQSWIKKNGPINRTEDLLDIEGLTVKILQKFCNSLLSEKTNESKTSRQRNAHFITPSIGELQRQKIRSCIAIRIGISSVCWSRIEIPTSNEEQIAPCLLTDWQHHDINEKKLHLNDLIQRCLYIDHLIPSADCYIFENPQMMQASTNPNADQQNINIQKAQVTAVLSFALSARRRIFDKEEILQADAEKRFEDDKIKISKAQDPLPNVFYLRRFLTARLFNHLVGNERISSEQTVINLMRTFYNIDQMEDLISEQEKHTGDDERISFRGNVQFPQELRQMFSRAERFQREFLGQALLLNLAFIRLVLLEDADSIELVTRNPNKRIVTDGVKS